MILWRCWKNASSSEKSHWFFIGTFRLNPGRVLTRNGLVNWAEVQSRVRLKERREVVEKGFTPKKKKKRWAWKAWKAWKIFRRKRLTCWRVTRVRFWPRGSTVTAIIVSVAARTVPYASGILTVESILRPINPTAVKSAMSTSHRTLFSLLIAFLQLSYLYIQNAIWFLTEFEMYAYSKFKTRFNL